MSHRCSNSGRYYRRCHMLRTLPRSIDGADQSRWRYFHRPGFIHRNVPHRRASLHDFHACCRKAQRNIHCSRRHWSLPLHCRAHRRLLHRRLRQPSALIWTFCREPQASTNTTGSTGSVPFLAPYWHQASTCSSRCSNTKPSTQTKMPPTQKATTSTLTSTPIILASLSHQKITLMRKECMVLHKNTV